MTELPPSLPPQTPSGRSLWPTFLGSIAFYTSLPIPSHWPMNFVGIARCAPLIGLLLGTLLAGIDAGLGELGMPLLVRSTILILVGLALTGGLHLDGAMDLADGLAVPDPHRRLEVMADSRTGAFGVMAAIAIVALKITALNSLVSHRWWILMAVAGWGRWGQLVAIARYPYLRPQGKGALHKAAIGSVWEVLPSWGLLVGVSGLWVLVGGTQTGMALGMVLGGSTIALLTGAWINHKLGGQTGDSYGAIVEWTEALLLGLMTMLVH